MSPDELPTIRKRESDPDYGPAPYVTGPVTIHDNLKSWDYYTDAMQKAVGRLAQTKPEPGHVRSEADKARRKAEQLEKRAAHLRKIATNAEKAAEAFEHTP